MNNNNMEWALIKEKVYYIDGTLRDIIIENMHLHLWEKWINYVNDRYSLKLKKFSSNIVLNHIDINLVKDCGQRPAIPENHYLCRRKNRFETEENMGIGQDLFKLIGVGTDWIFGNLWRTFRRKPRKSWKQIWNGDNEEIKDDLDVCGYELFYVMLGIILMVAFIWIINLLDK